METFKPDCVGISTMFSISHNNTINMAKIIKEFEWVGPVGVSFR